MDKDDIKFSSKNIKKKDLDFTVKDKKSTQVNNSVKNFRGKTAKHWKKFLTSPLMKGGRKFLTLGAATLIIAAAITLPIVLPKFLTPELTPEEQEHERMQTIGDAADIANNVDPEASDETRAAVLADFDAKIAAAAAADDEPLRTFLVQGKATVMLQYGMHDEAIIALESILDSVRSARRWAFLADIFDHIAEAHIAAGNKPAAAAAIREALAAVESSADDNALNIPITGSEYFSSRLQAIEAM